MNLLSNEPLVIENTPAYLARINEISEYIRSLPLTTEQNNTLVHMLTECQKLGRLDAFKQAIVLFRELAILTLSDCEHPLQ